MSCTVCKAKDCTLRAFSMVEARAAASAREHPPWKPGEKYTELPDDLRAIADYAFVPEGCHSPPEAMRWMMTGKGFGYSRGGDEGQWYYLLTTPTPLFQNQEGSSASMEKRLEQLALF